MKKFCCALALFMLLCTFSLANAAGDTLTVSLKLDKSSYKVGETATLDIEYNVPYIQGSSAYATFSLKGLKSPKLISTQTLICDDSTCNMVTDTSVFNFSGNKIKLGPGFSGNLSISFEVNNSREAFVSVTLVQDSETVKAKATADVSDYKADETPKPTSAPTQKPTAAPTSSVTVTKKPEADNENANTPHTGGLSLMLPALAMIAGGATIIKTKKGNKHHE